jgi:hypothetical protein
LDFINRMLAADAPLLLRPDGAGHLGLVVVHRLSRAHGLRVGLTARAPSGTTATVGLPSALLCEIPQDAAVPPDDRRAHLRVVTPATGGTASGRARVSGVPASQPDQTLEAAGGLPQRRPVSLRGASAARRGDEPASVPDERWADEIGSFAEGVHDASQRLTATEGIS